MEIQKDLIAQRRKRDAIRLIKPWLFVGPAAILLFIILLVPVVKVIQYSFFENRFFDKNSPFVGLANYKAVFADDRIGKMALFTVLFTIGSVFLHLLIGILLAVGVNSKVNTTWTTVFRVVFILPWVFTAAVVAVIWQLMLNPQGVFNSLLSSAFGRRVITEWLGNPKLAIGTLLFINAWRGYPFCMISLLAGLQNIPKSIYEAAEVDGATGLRQFFSITLPQLKPVFLSVGLLDGIWTMNLFPLIWLTTGGGPNGTTESIATLTYRMAFDEFEFGRASALGVVALIITLFLTRFYLKAQSQTAE
jgi:multiple sugar transport system permease protein